MEGKLTGKSTIIEIPENLLRTITVEELYDEDKFDFSKMEQKDLFLLLEYDNKYVLLLL